jgi:hypothetical protein
MQDSTKFLQTYSVYREAIFNVANVLKTAQQSSEFTAISRVPPCDTNIKCG